MGSQYIQVVLFHIQHNKNIQGCFILNIQAWFSSAVEQLLFSVCL